MPSTKNEKPRGFVFYAQDYFGDSAVRLMPGHLRIIWVEAFLLMDQSPRRGVLLKKNGSPYSNVELAGLMNVPVEHVDAALKMVVADGIADIDRATKAISCRKMIRDEIRRKTGSKFGRKGGGSPKLKQKSAKAQTTEDTKQIAAPIKAPMDVPLKQNRFDLYTTDPDPDPDPDPDHIQGSPLKHRSILDIPSVRSLSNERTNGSKTDYQKFWGPVEGFIRKQVVPDLFEELYAGCRIISMTSNDVVLAVPQALISHDGGDRQAAEYMTGRIRESQTGLLRGRVLKLISIEKLIEQELQK